MFIVPLSASSGPPKRGASSIAKLPNRNFANVFCTGILSIHVHCNFLEQRIYVFDNKHVNYAENAAFHLPYLKKHQLKTTMKTQSYFITSKLCYISFRKQIMITQFNCEIGHEKNTFKSSVGNSSTKIHD